jgi:hypothetical protein
MGNGTYVFSRTVVENCCKISVQPGIATGGAIGVEEAVTRVTNWLITFISTAGGLREMSKLVGY